MIVVAFFVSLLGQKLLPTVHWDGLFRRLSPKSICHRALQSSSPVVLHFPLILLFIWSTLCVFALISPIMVIVLFQCFCTIYISLSVGSGQSCYKLVRWHCLLLMRQWVSELHVMINYLPMQSKPIGVDCLRSHMTTVFNFACFSLSLCAVLLLLQCSLVLPVTAAVPSGGCWMGNCSTDSALGRLTRHVLALPNVSQLVQTAARFALSSLDSLNAH